ncbi:hypothetical protein DXG01_016000, partial [Tephrocybe rancida]
ESANNNSHKDPTTAPPPFDDQKADIILRSNISAVDFYVFKAFLSYASPFFESMFSLPHGSAAREDKDGKPVIPVEEDAETLAVLLKHCYPLWSSYFGESTLEELLKAREASEKYQMEGVEASVADKTLTRDK